MFTLQIHTVDPPKPLVIAATAPFTTVVSSRSKSNPNPSNHPTERKGVVHFFRRLPSPAALRTPLLFIVAVPSYISPDDFFSFSGNRIDNYSDVCFLRDDGMEGRYCIIVKLVDQISADEFFDYINGKRFDPSQNEVCHVYFVQWVGYMKLAEIAAKPPPDFVELPTCPICLERLDQDTSAITTTHCDHSFGCSCGSKWNLSCQVCLLCRSQDEKPNCEECGSSNSPWVCLICGFVGCGRSEQMHAIEHGINTKHNYSLELETHRIWDYVGEKYAQRLNQSKPYGKSVETEFSQMSLDGECDNNADCSPVETIVDESYHLLATPMETQRQHYEKLLAEARTRKENINAAVKKSEAAMIQVFQNRLDKLAEDTKILEEHNKVLRETEESLMQIYKETEKRESVLLSSRDEQIRDLKVQIEEWNIFSETIRKFSNSKETGDICDGALLPEQSNQLNQQIRDLKAQHDKVLRETEESLMQIHKEIEKRESFLLSSRDKQIRDLLKVQIEELNIFSENIRKLSNTKDTGDIWEETVLPEQSNQLNSGNNPKRRVKPCKIRRGGKSGKKG